MKHHRDLHSDELAQLEALIDSAGLNSVLMALSEICDLKAIHIAENWQDTRLAKQWATMSGLIGCAVPQAGGL